MSSVRPQAGAAVAPPLAPIASEGEVVVAGQPPVVPEISPEIAQEVAEQPHRITLRRPEEPTMRERLEHEELHEPYRAWCPACVGGRGGGGGMEGW